LPNQYFVIPDQVLIHNLRRKKLRIPIAPEKHFRKFNYPTKKADNKPMTPRWSYCPLTSKQWADFSSLFGERGACGGYRCMYWKLSNEDFRAGVYEKNRVAQKALVDSGVVPGILAYRDEIPIGWIALELRDHYPRLMRSRILKPVENKPVWFLCFFTPRDQRGCGETVRLLGAAMEHVYRHGGRTLEGYPIDTGDKRISPTAVYTGTVSAFVRAGFIEVARNSTKRPIFRYSVGAR
jgi:hypothetical protein